MPRLLATLALLRFSVRNTDDIPGEEETGSVTDAVTNRYRCLPTANNMSNGVYPPSRGVTDGAAYFATNPPPKILDSHRRLAKAFINDQLESARNIVLVTSGVPQSHWRIRLYDSSTTSQTAAVELLLLNTFFKPDMLSSFFTGNSPCYHSPDTIAILRTVSWI